MLSRVNTSWVIPVERPLVGWLAAKLPAAVTPDHLTLTGFVGAVVCGIGYAASWWSPIWLWLASAGLIVNWFGDSLDGTLARFRRIERPRYGFFIDNTTDFLSLLCVFFGLGISPYMRFSIACLGLVAYYMASFFNLIRSIDTQVIQIGYYGIGPTEIRLGLIGYNFFLLTIGDWPVKTPLGLMSLIDCSVIMAFVAVLVSFLVMVWSEGRRLAQEEGPLRTE